jgi:hypothetical protein
MTWSQATTWADGLSYYDSERDITWTDWRLPLTMPVNGSTYNYTHLNDGSSDDGYNISAPGTVYAGSTGSEMAYLFLYELGNLGYCDASGECPQEGWGLTKTGPFTNIMDGNYWSGTEYGRDVPGLPSGYNAWCFHSDNGAQGYLGKASPLYAWPVRTGDVPIPGAVWLLASGLIGIIGFRKRFNFKKLLPLLLCCFFLCLAIHAQAALYDRGGGLIYDSDQDITWLQDADYAFSSGYDPDGNLNWDQAVQWADTLVYQGYDDWRLPTTPGTASGYINQGEMGHLFYGYGVSYFSQNPFYNIQPFGYYWSSTEYAPVPTEAWYFYFDDGYHGIGNKEANYHNAWAVRDGDSSPVPIPGAVWLLGSGLIALVGLRKKLMK